MKNPCFFHEHFFNCTFWNFLEHSAHLYYVGTYYQKIKGFTGRASLCYARLGSHKLNLSVVLCNTTMRTM